MQKYEPLEQEPAILKFWLENKIYEKANEQVQNGKKFYFCDGPPYTSGKVHLGTAWNKSYKDSIIRYKRMQGFKVLDRAGYDMHGLPTENATEKELGIKDKSEIEKMGVDKFVKACKELSIRNLKIMNKDFERLGVWMDFENAYQSVTPEFISGVWWLVKKAHENGRLYEGMRSMAWDWAHQTAVAKHELEYQNVTDESIYVKMQVEGGENEYFIIWTTTPWTIAYNLGIMANPNVDYVKCSADDETWILAKDLVKSLEKLTGKDLTIISELKGKELEGCAYVHPFYDELKDHYDRIKGKHAKTHTVVMSEEHVDTTSGSGLVHMAPGCGPADYEVGHANGIPAWNETLEDGHYSDKMGVFSGRHAYNENSSFTEDLEKKNALVATQKYKHEYPHGERSKKPVIFRTTKQWFFKVEDIKPDMIKENDERIWVPKAGYNAFNSWLENLRDNSVSKQRYWGTPIPVWRNEKDPDDYIVVGSVKELEELSGQKVPEPHIPWIDDVTIEKDGKVYRRIPDILDVWVDAGSASWNSLGYPFNEDESSMENYPMDFILEGKDQIRGWFNLLHVASKIALNNNCFKACFMHGFINDAGGRKMSKSLGNYILPGEVIEKYGADTLRFYMIGGTAAGTDLNYNFDDMKVKYRNLGVLWNIHNYVLDLYHQIDLNPAELRLEDGFEIEEKYIFSKLHSTIKKMTEIYDNYRLNEAPHPVEELFLDLSRVYIQLTRDKAGNEHKKHVVMFTIYHVLIDALRLLSPIAPFISEQIYQNLKKELNLKDESIHHTGWPSFDEKKIDTSLEKQMDVASDVIQGILSCREKMNRGQRWPLSEAVIVTSEEAVSEACTKLKDIISKQTNVKNITCVSALPDVKVKVKVDFGKLGPDFGNKTPMIIEHLNKHSPESIMQHIEKNDQFVMSIDGEDLAILQKHLIVDRDVPEKFIEGAFSGGQVYVNKEVSKELEAEGYARELMRRVQSLRKESGLSKSDSIYLHVKTDSKMGKMLKDHEKSISDKVGATDLVISDKDPDKKLAHSSKEKVKDWEFEIFLEKA